MTERRTPIDLPLHLVLADGGELTVRSIEAGDVAGVRALYERLSPEAVYRRFFTATLPPPPFFDRLVAVTERGGVGLVAVSSSAIVGEVDVEPLANGNGEVAIVVDGRWRGWLGPYLVELASREAARRGIPNLEAEILTCNRPMRAITRARGEAYLPTSDWQEVRVVFSSDGPAPGWASAGGRPEDLPRVLIEQRGAAFDAVAGLPAAGFDVIACAGRATGQRGCPLLRGAACPLADGADVILVVMAPGRERDALVAAHHRAGSAVAVIEPSRSAPLTADVLVDAARSMIGSDPDVGADLEHPVVRQAEEP